MDEKTGMTTTGQATGLTSFFEHERMYTSLNVKDQKQAAMYLRAMAKADFGFDDVEGQTLKITNAILHECDIVDRETGEISREIRTVLICEDGSSVGFVSKGIVSGLKRLFVVYGVMPWNPPRELVVSRVRAKVAGYMYLITPPESV